MTPTARTLAHLRALGYRADVVERRLPQCFVTRDLFGIIDVLPVRPAEILGVQCVSAAPPVPRVSELGKAIRGHST